MFGSWIFSCVFFLNVSELPGVRWVLPDSYLDVKNKDYGGQGVHFLSFGIIKISKGTHIIVCSEIFERLFPCSLNLIESTCCYCKFFFFFFLILRSKLTSLAQFS